MGWARLRPKLRPLAGREVTPAAIVVHLGSNDLGSMSLKALIGWAKTEIDWLVATFPATEIIWSDILARQFIEVPFLRKRWNPVEKPTTHHYAPILK